MSDNQLIEAILLLLSGLLPTSVVLLRRRLFEEGLVAAAILEIRRHCRAGTAVGPIGINGLAKTAFPVAFFGVDHNCLRRKRQAQLAVQQVFLAPNGTMPTPRRTTARRYRLPK